MRLVSSVVMAAILAGGCAPADQRAANPGNAIDPPAANRAQPGWDLEASGEGSALVFGQGGSPVLRLFCPAAANRLVVTVAAFRAIASEERLSLGSGETVVALVADPAADAQRGGVSGAGAVPADLKGLVAGPVSASYGAQVSGPHPMPPAELSRQFVTACFRGAEAAGIAASKPTPSTNPCLVQDGELLRVSPLRAIGTEPFWGARVEGRCVIYSTPEDQQGTRVWTRFNTGPAGGIWTGTLRGRRFVLVTQPKIDCSDGMSDRRYPIDVQLTVDGEERRGCAEPL
ncbi:hypothetical protein [Sphingomonas sp.]|uniref:COG3650 family protein n=1 Tax=Sphingomonas sp. TaxID=28214 RepID=UPI00286D8A13|nr:hypothetical protein [Sphingomonas sp.]